MSSAQSGTMSDRLAQLRGVAEVRSPNVRSLAKFAANHTCNLANVGFAAQVDFDKLLEGTRYAVPYGQSPFAFRRGNRFEEQLREDRHGPVRALLRETLGLKVDPTRVVNVRDIRGQMAKRAETTRELVAKIVRGEQGAPQLLDGAVLSREIGGRRAFFEADAVAVSIDGSIRAGEVKSFPTVDGQADPEKVGAAIAQVAIYLLLLRDLVTASGGEPELVSTDALIITPKNTGLQPTMTVKRIGREVDRADRILRRAPAADELIADLSSKVPSFGAVAKGPSEDARIEAASELADAVGTTYVPNCLSSCGMSRLCRERAHASGDPARVSGQLVRLLPGIDSIDRAGELACGAKASDEESAAAEQLVRVERLRRRFAAGGKS